MGGPVTVVHNEDDIIVRGGVCFVLTEKDDATGVENITEKDDNNVKPGMKYFFSLDGKQFSAPQKRLNIQKMTDGTTRKIVIK